MDELSLIEHEQIAAFMSTGIVSSYKNFSKLYNNSFKYSTGGGTNNALPGLVPPTQFCEFPKCSWITC